MDVARAKAPMHLGVWYDFRNPAAWRIPWQQLYNETLDQASWAEELGFNSIWLSEHHFTDDGYMPSLPTALGAIVARTERVRLGTAVLLAPLHHPLRLAEDLAVVDLISKGRLDVGLALGYRSKEFEVMAVPRSERGRRTEETVELLRLAWSGREFSFDGACYRFEDVIVTPPPAQSPSPPIFLGGSSIPAARRAGRLGCGFAADSGGSLDLYDVYADAFTVVEGGLDAPEIRTNRLVYVCRDPDRAWEMLGPHLLYQHNVYAQWASEAGRSGFAAARSAEPGGAVDGRLPDRDLAAGARRAEAHLRGRSGHRSDLLGATARSHPRGQLCLAAVDRRRDPACPRE